MRWTLWACALLLFPALAWAVPAGILPKELEGMEILDRQGTVVPSDILLVDEAGNAVRFGDFLGKERPLVVQLAYYECPMLCTQV
ncbi:MAG TPA: SCO family protein, partial [Candidatus Eisenbacteria bacterium]|nr:SCO family protein [Candidatus Eisenbacteria bacterium]